MNADDLMEGYNGDEPYPEDDHALGEHTDAYEPTCKDCRRERLERLLEEAD